MKVISYQQLRKLPPDTFFSTLSGDNELGELWLTGEYPWGGRFVYSAMSDVSGAGRTEVDFEDNTFDRKSHFVVWAKEELEAFIEKVQGILRFEGAPVASEGAALINPLTGTGVATSANAANHAVRAQLKQPIGYLSEAGLQKLAQGVGALLSATNVDGFPVYLDAPMEQ